MTVPAAADTETAPAKSPRKRWPLLAGALAIALVGTVGAVVARREGGPEEVVEEFFAAIRDRDVERALSHVGRIGHGVPYGEAAAFLHPDAIADGWQLREAHAGEPDLGGDVRVEVNIGDEQAHTEGVIEVTDFGGEWKLVDPFVTVAFSAAPFTYLQVNDRVVRPEELYGHNLGGAFAGAYKLLPGRYHFFGDLAGTTTNPDPAQLLLPPRPDTVTADPVPVTPPPLRFPTETDAAVQRLVNDLLDDCTTYAVREPPGCPFAVGLFLDHGDGSVDLLHDIVWTVVEYPQVRLADPGGEERRNGLVVEVDDPGLIRLSATGMDDHGQMVEVVADCRVSGEYLRAALQPDGTPEVYLAAFTLLGFGSVIRHPTRNTCEGGDLS